MTLVIDASATVAYLLGAGTEEERGAMLDDPQAPALIDVEVTQTLRGLVRGGKLAPGSAEAARQDLPWLGIHRHPDAVLLDRAWDLRDRCTIYDGLYVALAEAVRGTLVTRDGRLARAVVDLIDVRTTG
jgi:predicted nucleic acid-binding protein